MEFWCGGYGWQAVVPGTRVSMISVSQEGLKLRLARSGYPLQFALLGYTRPRALPIRLWHLIIGHRSIQDIRKTALAVRGMKLDDPDPISDLQYHSCELSKSPLQINRALGKIPDHALEEVSIDVVGPITLIGFFGHRYATLITDRKSRVR
jgi:hypothetical protein